MVLNATVNNISFISCQSVLQMKETRVLSIQYTLPSAGFELTTVVVIGTDCIGSCKSNYNMIMTMAAPHCLESIVLCKMVGRRQKKFFCYHLNLVIVLMFIKYYLTVINMNPFLFLNLKSTEYTKLEINLRNSKINIYIFFQLIAKSDFVVIG